MRLKINGEERDVEATEVTVAALLRLLDMPTNRGVAVAVNDEVVPRSAWEERDLEDDDRVEIIRAAQGG